MIDNINLIINKKSFEMSSVSQNITGEIFFKVGDEYFPDEGWNDFVIILLCWWLEALASFSVFKKNGIVKRIFDFMGGLAFNTGTTELFGRIP